MAIAIVNTTSKTATGLNTTVDCSALNCTGGNFIVVGERTNGTSTGITDTAGNTYTLIGTAGGGAGPAKLWYAKNITGNASNVIRVTYSGANGDFVSIHVIQYSGGATGTLLDSGATTTTVGASSTSVTSATFDTANNGETIVAFGTQTGSGQTYTAGANYISEVTTASFGPAITEDRLTGNKLTGAVVTMSSTATAVWAVVSAAFIPATIPATNSGFTMIF